MAKNARTTNLERGIEALRKWNCDEAIALLRPLAEVGDATAQFYMGRACEAKYGDDAPHDAVGWYRKAIAGGNMEAVYALGLLFLSDEEFGPTEAAKGQKLLRQAAQHFKSAAGKGNAQAQCRFGKNLVRGDGVAQDRARGLEWWRKGATVAGFGWHCALGSELLWGDDTTEAERLEGFRWFERAAMDGHTGAAYLLGAHYASGDGIPKDLKKAIYWYEIAMARGDAEAKYNLGCMYCSGEGGPVDCTYGRQLLIEAGEKGDFNALFLLCDAYHDAFWGFAKDETRAAYWRAEYLRVIGKPHPRVEEAGDDE